MQLVTIKKKKLTGGPTSPASPFFPFLPRFPGGPGSPGGPVTEKKNKSKLNVVDLNLATWMINSKKKKKCKEKMRKICKIFTLVTSFLV